MALPGNRFWWWWSYRDGPAEHVGVAPPEAAYIASGRGETGVAPPAPGAWKAVLVTEYLCGDGGWGVRLAWARQTVDTPALYAVTLAAVLGGWGFERLLRRLGRRFSC